MHACNSNSHSVDQCAAQRGLAGITTLYIRLYLNATPLAEVLWGQGVPCQQEAGSSRRVVEAGDTPKVKPPAHLPGVSPPGAEGVAGRTSGPTSLTAGPYLDAPQLG